MLIISVIKPIFFIGKWKKIKSFKTSFNNKNSNSLSHIKITLILFFVQKMVELWLFFISCFWILDLKVCLKKLGIGSGLYGKSVLYLLNTHLFLSSVLWSYGLKGFEILHKIVPFNFFFMQIKGINSLGNMHHVMGVLSRRKKFFK